MSAPEPAQRPRAASRQAPGNAAPPSRPQSEGREHFIPLRRDDLVHMLAADPGLSDVQRKRFLNLCRLLLVTFHFEHHEKLEQLKNAYAPFDPDAVTHRAEPRSSQERERLADLLFDRFTALLESANYERLTRADIEQALEAASDWGLNLDVDFDAFQRLEVYVRGQIAEPRVRRSWRKLYREHEIDVPIYQRLVVIFAFRKQRRLPDNVETDPVYMKILKNIPQMDLEMILPGTRVKMTMLDRGRILLPTLSGVALTALKIIQGALVFVFTGLYGVLAFLGVVGGTIGYGMKSFFGYQNVKNRYQLNLTRSLYYQNLDNNAGVLYRLIDESEEQECREAILAYFLLWRRAPRQGWLRAELDRRAEVYLRDEAGVDVDFEIGDALDKLDRLGLAQSDSDQRWRATPVEESLRRLDRAWDHYFQYNQRPDAPP